MHLFEKIVSPVCMKKVSILGIYSDTQKANKQLRKFHKITRYFFIPEIVLSPFIYHFFRDRCVDEIYHFNEMHHNKLLNTDNLANTDKFKYWFMTIVIKILSSMNI